MILRAEPRTIMRFVEDNYEVLTRLYKLQLQNNLIAAETFEEVTRHKGDIVTRRLSAFKIVRTVGDDYRLTEEVAAYLGFLMQEFKPLLPEQLHRYKVSIEDMYELLIIRKNMDDDLRRLRLQHLYDEVNSFLDNVTNNTYTLLKRSQQLKVNRQQMTYAERVKEARLLIEQYIQPLNHIVNLNDANSIASLLQNIAREINLDRMANYSPSVVEGYEQLDNLLRQVNGRLQREGDVIRRELMPLIERIQRESEVLGGWLVFLDRPLLAAVPEMGKRHVSSTFGDQTLADLRMYVEQFLQHRKTARITLNTAAPMPDVTLFDRRKYRQQLRDAIPMEDFFNWCAEATSESPPHLRERDMFNLTNLLLSESESYDLSFTAQRSSRVVNGNRYDFPLLRISHKIKTNEE